MCDKVRASSQTSSTSSKYSSSDDDLYAIWLKNLETTDQERKFKVRSNQPVDANLELISGNLQLTYTDSAPPTPTSSQRSTPENTPQKTKIIELQTPGEYESPDQADMAIMNTPSKKRGDLLRKNLGKLFQKFQKYNGRQDNESFGPTYRRFNCSLYDHFDKFNATHNSSQFCIEAN